MPSSMRREVMRPTLFAAIIQIIALACEPTAAVDPADKKLVPEASLMVGVSSLAASPVSWSEIDLAWPTSSSVSGYQVFRSTSGPAGGYNLIATTAATVGNYADRGLTASAQYCYEVRSFKNTGRNVSYSSYSSPACATTSPPPVAAASAINAVPQAMQILVTWQDNSANEDGFHIERSSSAIGPWSQLANASANATSVSVSATAEEQACFRVIAFNAIGPSLPSPVDCTTLPASPTSLSAGAHDGVISLGWLDNSAVEDGYKVSRLEPGGVWTDIATLPANSGYYGNYLDIAVTAGVTYTYRVQALKDGGYSELSNEASAIIATALPAAPTDASAGFDGGFDPYLHLYLFVSWSDNSSNEDVFEIDWSPDGVTDWTPFGSAPANATSFFQDIGTGGWPQDGCFRVRAVNGLGSSEPSNFSCASAPQGLPGGESIIRPTVPIAAAPQPLRNVGVDRARRGDGSRVKRAPRTMKR